MRSAASTPAAPPSKPLREFAMVVAAVVFPLILKQIAGNKSVAAANLPYRKRDYLLTAAERSFYEVLYSVLDDQLIVFPKVRLADLVYMPKGTADRQTHFNRIQSKHVDFVLCDREKIRPVLVIELDDASHEEEARRDRDTFVDASLSAAGLPILHIPAQRSYIPAELAAAVHQKLQPVSGSAVGVIVSLRA
jgi:hypothetical protein